MPVIRERDNPHVCRSWPVVSRNIVSAVNLLQRDNSLRNLLFLRGFPRGTAMDALRQLVELAALLAAQLRIHR